MGFIQEEVMLRPIEEEADAVDNPSDVVNLEECLGIPLNEDWLQSLGLMEDEHNSPDYGVWYYFQDRRLIIKLNIRGSHRVEIYNSPLARVSFVHHLQNLHLLIIGDPLTVKSYPDLWNLYANGLGATQRQNW